jgi:hypothetical protein
MNFNFNLQPNKYIIGCFVLLCLLIAVFLLIRSRKNTLKNNTMENVSPYVMIGALRNETQNVILVNVLGDKIPYLIHCVDGKNTLNLTNSQFETYLNENPNLEEIDLVILYCASWSCGAAHNYYQKLETMGIPMERIYDYKGALHEWAMYSLIYPELFVLYSLNNKSLATEEELKEITSNMMHTYLLKDEKKSTNNILTNLSSYGETQITIDNNTDNKVSNNDVVNNEVDNNQVNNEVANNQVNNEVANNQINNEVANNEVNNLPNNQIIN